MTDTALKNPIVTAVQAVKSGEDVVAVSSSNLLPVMSRPNPMTSSVESCLRGRLFKGWATCAAVSVKNSAIQIWNPTNSTMTLQIVALNAYNSAGTMKWYPLISTSPLTTLTGNTISLNTVIGTPRFEIRCDNLATRTSNTSLGVTISATTPVGTGLLLSGEIYLLAPNTGLTYEAETQNIAMNLHITAVEMPTSEIYV